MVSSPYYLAFVGDCREPEQPQSLSIQAFWRRLLAYPAANHLVARVDWTWLVGEIFSDSDRFNPRRTSPCLPGLSLVVATQPYCRPVSRL